MSSEPLASSNVSDPGSWRRQCPHRSAHAGTFWRARSKLSVRMVQASHRRDRRARPGPGPRGAALGASLRRSFEPPPGRPAREATAPPLTVSRRLRTSPADSGGSSTTPTPALAAVVPLARWSAINGSTLRGTRAPRAPRRVPDPPWQTTTAAACSTVSWGTNASTCRSDAETPVLGYCPLETVRSPRTGSCEMAVAIASKAGMVRGRSLGATVPSGM
jgi:hypothetical protein